jgi:hypothetical protein
MFREILVKAFLNSGTINSKKHLIVFSEDFGYQHGRSGSTNLDLDLMNNYFGATFVADRPGSTGNHGMIGQAPHFSGTDSTIGQWPDVFGIFDNINAVATHRYRFDNSIHGLGQNHAWIYNTAFRNRCPCNEECYRFTQSIWVLLQAE